MSGKAQVVGPYAKFESIPANLTTMTAAGFTFSTTPAFTRATSNQRSGAACLLGSSSTTGAYFDTPTIIKVKTFSFYIRKLSNNTNQMAYKVEFINGATSAISDAATYPGVTAVTAAALPNNVSPLASPYQLVTFTFPNTMPNGKIRVTDNRVSGVTGGIYIDDIVWDCYKADGTASIGWPENKIVVPIQNGVGTPTANTGGTINIASDAVYSFYDNGGESDNYNISQSNVVTFVPINGASGEKARISFVSYAGEAINDYVEVFDGPNVLATRILNHTTAVMPTPTTSFTSTATNGELTVRFTSSASVVAAGFNITADISPCAVIGSASVGSINPTDATLTWSAASPIPTNYDIYISNSATPAPTGTTTPTVTVANTPTSYLLSSLSPNTQYFVWVRTKCSSTNFGSWTAITGASFTTPCAAVDVTYTQDFSSATAPQIPACNTAVTAGGTTGSWVTSATAGSGYGFAGNVARFSHGSGTADAWYITQGINLVNTKTYRLTFTYSNTTTLTENMKVAIGTSKTAAGMTTTLATFSSITVGTATTYWLDFVPATNTVYYVGFQSYGTSTAGWILLDDIIVAETTCYAPAYSSLAASSITPSTATLNWSVPSSGTPTGYQYYISTVNSPPTFYTAATGNATSNSIPVTGLSPTTPYYFWIRSNCGSGNYSSWSSIANPGTFTTTGITNISMSNTPISNCGVNYYDSGGSGGNYADGQNFTQTFTPASAGSKIKAVFNTFRTERRYDFLKIYDGPNATYPLLGSFSGNQMGAGRTFVSTAANGELTFVFTSDGSNVFFGWTATITCVTVPRIDSFSPLSICASASNTNVTLTGLNFTGVTSVLFNATSVSFTVVNDTTIIASVPPSATTGVVTVANTQASTYSPSSFVVNPLPTALIISPASATICQTDPAQLLTASGGIVPNIAVINENFNGTAAGWTKTNASTGGSTASAAWTLRPNGYNPGGTSGITVMRSNDTSQFYVSNSDAQGSGTTTDVTLTSPVFSLVGFTLANLSFYHCYKAYDNGYARVEIYNSATATWVALQQWNTYDPVDESQGTPTNFKYQSYNLSPYLGMANLQVRFRYNVDWGFVWAIDNFLISASSGTGVTWSGSSSTSDYTGLYTNSAATTAYTGGVVSSVYVLPSATTTYYATATSVALCSVTTSVLITVTPLAAGIASSDQSICGGAPSDLTLTGSSGTIQWEYADNLAFNSGVTTISGATSATLTSTQMGGVLTANRYFRAKLTNGSCTTYSNIVSVITALITTTWNGSGWSNGLPSSTKAVVFDGPYTSDPITNSVSPGNISACNVSVTSLGAVTFIAGHTLTVENSLNIDYTNGGRLIFEDGSSLYQPNAVTNATGVYSGGNSGNITYMRTASPMYKFDYTYWSSPVNPQNLLTLSPLTPLFYQYDGVTANQWQYVNGGVTNMTIGKGYLIRAPNNFPVYVNPLTPLPSYFTASFSGVPNNGSQSIQIGVAQGINQFNLLGNPYPSAIFADNFISANPNIGALYFWTHNTNLTIIASGLGAGTYQYTNDDYAIYTLAGGIGTQPSGLDGAGVNVQPNGYISAGQGFFTKGVATITGDGPNYYANFTNSMRRAGNNGQFFKTGSTPVTQNDISFEKHRYWLNIANTEGAFREVLIGYIETATIGIDRLFDGEMSESSNVISLYTFVDEKRMAIQARPLPFEVSDTVPLGYKTTIASTYTIKMPQYDGLFTSQPVYLEDTLLNVIHDLRTDPYSFATEIGTFNNRFILRYTTDALGTPVFTANSVVVYTNEQGLVINTGTEPMETVTIFDIQGRLLATQKPGGAITTVFATLPKTQQVLLVKIESEHGVVTKKVSF